jgi:hypothetical protein
LFGDPRFDLLPVSKQQKPYIGIPAARDICAGYDDVRRVIATHGIQGYVDGLAQLRPLSSRTERPMSQLNFIFDLNDLPAFVKASFHIHMVRPVVFAGILIFDVGRRLQGVVGTSLVAARFRNFLSGNSHRVFLYSGTYRRQAPARQDAGN